MERKKNIYADYHPFGMRMFSRSSNSSSYRYGWQGKFEKDDEVKGEGNHIDWGGYGYDPRIIRRLSPDPLQPKYPWQSPYSALGNNPILNQEIDGQDYEVFIDHSAKTIIVKATIYTCVENIEECYSATDAAQFWNEQSGKYQYKVGKGKNAVYYDIVFEINVQESENPTEDSSEGKVYSIDKETDQVKLESGSGNFYEIVDDSYPLDSETGNGQTESGNLIKVKDSRKQSETGSHELGHMLGFKHKRGTLMSAASNIGRKLKIDKVIVAQILKNVDLGKRTYPEYYQGGGSGYTKSKDENSKPENFENGKVINKK